MTSVLCHYIAFIFLLTAGLCNTSTGHNPHGLAMARRHELWMAEHGRIYKDEAERAMRFEIFKQNVKYIEDFNNAGKHSYTLGINLFVDLTNEEFVATYASGFKTLDGELKGSLRSIKYETIEEEKEEEVPSYITIPDSVDWRAEGAVTRVKSQVACSCCWAITTAAAIEGLYKIKKGILYDLSVQQLLDCTGGTNDCTGGHVHEALEYVVSNGGITTWANYPYADTQNTCDQTKEKQTVASIKGYKWCKGGEAKLRAAVAKQPVVVAVDISGADFQLYTGGIFNGPCKTDVNHAMVAVGYGEEGGEEFWIMKNSWSKNWGEDGYMRMQRDDGTPEGLCGIFSSPVYPTM